MNYNLPNIPSRENKPREKGLTMVMDKGLSLSEAENMIMSSSNFIDIVKLGFGTSLITQNLDEKIKIYQNNGIDVYFGGTLFEAFIARGLFDEYIKYLHKYNMKHVEVSDGVLPINEDDKCEYINILSKEFTVLSEVGYKTGERKLSNKDWVDKIEKEYNAGAWRIIAEARESGNIGIYNNDGSANEELINKITTVLSPEKILWEAPLKKQQVWFIKLMGANVNLGNIPTNEILALETLRLGLRGDTLLDFLPKE